MRQNARWRFGSLGALLTALWLGILLAGSSPQIHHLFHSDSNAPEHSCAIEQVSHGAVLFSCAASFVAPSLHLIVSRFELPSAPHLSCDFCLPPNRGPPVSAMPRTVAG
jgi:hypothetical protein